MFCARVVGISFVAYFGTVIQAGRYSSQEIGSMAREKLAQVLQDLRDLRTRPALLGFFIGLVLAFVVRRLLLDDNVLGFAGLPILAVMSCFWVHRPIYLTICIALFVGTFLGILLWNPAGL